MTLNSILHFQQPQNETLKYLNPEVMLLCSIITFFLLILDMSTSNLYG